MRIQLIPGISELRCHLCRNEENLRGDSGFPARQINLRVAGASAAAPLCPLSLRGPMSATSRPGRVGLETPHQADTGRPPGAAEGPGSSTRSQGPRGPGLLGWDWLGR